MTCWRKASRAPTVPRRGPHNHNRHSRGRRATMATFGETKRELDLETLTLESGAHDADDGRMCVMEAVAWLAGEPWSDAPQCASPVLAAFCRAWNDTDGEA